MRGCEWVTLSACLCMAEGTRTPGPWSPLHLSSASCLQRATRLYKFPALSCSPLSLHHHCSYIQSHMFDRNCPLVIKPLQACRWLCMCAYVTWGEKVALCRWQSRSEDETIEHACEDMRETVLHRESDSESENEKVLAWDRVCVREEERERSYSQPSCMCLMSITSFNQEKYVCIQIKHKTPLLPGAFLPCLFVLLEAAC